MVRGTLGWSLNDPDEPTGGKKKQAVAIPGGRHRATSLSSEPTFRWFSSSGTSDLRNGRCPFLALSVLQRAANAGKRRHKAKVEDRPILQAMERDPETSSTRAQRTTNVSFSAC
jgi:hypothetical protein